MDNAQIAKEVVAALGGRENVRSVALCNAFTMLWLLMKKNRQNKIENQIKFKAFFNSGQYQIILVQVLLTRCITKLLLLACQLHQKMNKSRS